VASAASPSKVFSPNARTLVSRRGLCLTTTDLLARSIQIVARHSQRIHNTVHSRTERAPVCIAESGIDRVATLDLDKAQSWFADGGTRWSAADKIIPPAELADLAVKFQREDEFITEARRTLRKPSFRTEQKFQTQAVLPHS
jgi:hypothetical protein